MDLRPLFAYVYLAQLQKDLDYPANATFLKVCYLDWRIGDLELPDPMPIADELRHPISNYSLLIVRSFILGRF